MIKKITVGSFFENCYLYSLKNGETAIIDPGSDVKLIENAIKSEHLNPIIIICTHGHFDHISAIKDLKKIYPEIKIAAHKDALSNFGEEGIKNNSNLINLFGYGLDEYYKKALTDGVPLPDIILKENDKIFENKLKVIHTPGHSKGSICLYNKEEKILFSGDTIFYDNIGRTDLRGGSYQEIKESITNKLWNLDEETRYYPGHGEPNTIKEGKKLINFF